MKQTIHTGSRWAALILASLIPAGSMVNAAAAALGSAFTLQGHLLDNGAPAKGIYDLQFAVFDTANGGNLLRPPLEVIALPVSNGLFTVVVDFGDGVFGADQRYLEMGARKSGNAVPYEIIPPRMLLTAAPQALFALSAGAVPDGAITGAKLAQGAIGASALSVPAPPSAGQVLGFDGVSLTWQAPVAPGGGSGAWAVSGNAGTIAGTHFLGTTDNQALELKVAGQRALRLLPASDPGYGFSPNLIGGYGGNLVGPGVSASTIAGGGGINYTHQIYDSWSTIGGGDANIIRPGSYQSTIGGGYTNTIGPASPNSTIAGGRLNTIQGTNSGWSAIGGGGNHVIYDNAAYSTIAGGFNNLIKTGSSSSAIGGGGNNTIDPGSDISTIAGGAANWIKGNSWRSAIGGGTENVIEGAVWSTIAGGGNNFIHAGSPRSSIGGGTQNLIGSGSDFGTIAGGGGNLIGDSGWRSAIGGGTENLIDHGSVWGTIAGGGNNIIRSASARCTIGGGTENAIAENALAATVPGGANNTAGGAYSFAAGQHASALSSGSFVWASGNANPVYDSGPNSFTVAAPGGVHIASERGISLEASDNPIITRGWDPFDNTAGNRAGHGRWGLFMEPSRLVCGIPVLDNRSFEVAKYFPNGGRQELLRVDQDGRTTVGILTIRGGADVAEPFAMSHGELQKGSVVIIDEEHPGRLKLSARAYDRRVAGIISGANGIQPGISLSQEGVNAEGQNVALSGRVYALADAAAGAIRPGDLLTTSDRPGHAMKVTDHEKARGAVLGKAMSGLAKGQGYVLVLVTLQ